METLNLLNWTCAVWSLVLLWYRKPKRPYILWYIANMPAILLHELAHYVVGLSLGARPQGLYFSLDVQSGYLVLGNTKFYNLNFVNVLPIGLAPLIWLGIWWVWISHVSIAKYWGITTTLSIYLWRAGIPSVSDFKTALNWRSVLTWTLLIWLAWNAWFIVKDTIPSLPKMTNLIFPTL